MTYMTYILVFLGMVILDICYAVYTRRASQGCSLQAASMAAAIILLSGYVTISYTSDPLALIPAVMGAFAGTALAVHFDNRPGV